MTEYVKKTPFGGYREVQGGYSSPEWEYAILSREDYEQDKNELRMARIEKNEAIEKAHRSIQNAQTELSRGIAEVKKAAAEQVKQLECELAAAKEEIVYQQGLNKNLLRISKERANADRKLKSKKEHTGYVVISSSEKLQRYLNGHNKWRSVVLWETVIQSPYSMDFTEEQARKQIIEELVIRDEKKEWKIAKIGITAVFGKGYEALIIDDKWKGLIKQHNIIVEWRLRENCRVGYWEFVFLHTKPLGVIPKDMRVR